jgi:hypothetical protein
MRTLVAVLFWIAACGGGHEAKQPQPDQTTQTDAAVATPPNGASSDASVTNVQTDASVAAAPEAGPSDDVDKTVSVCGDESIPIEKRVRKKVKECWSEAASRHPGLDGHVQVKFVIDAQGKIKKTLLKQKKTLGPATSACIMAAIHAYKLDGTKCAGKTVGFEMAFGRAAMD